MTVAVVRSEKEITPRQRAGFSLYQGRRRGVSAGSHVHDLVALGKAIALCPGCESKFDAERNGYFTPASLSHVRGPCDGCRQYHPFERLFMPLGRLPV